ncbi:metallophosphoesterase [uncultured Methylobacterium sp.]|jgi:alkaline phosphatase D|uniref:metallophosphoesterase family protein n=1 Tax=uncultured Methylobacterium sp. TaxID=157278 RepID=UPI002607397A|nr:metallophosphoesterase [uncultured Methylobacterium sp.]
MRIIQISDTHLSREHGDFAANLAIVGEEVAATAADLVIHTGDLSMNGAVGPDDLDDALAWMRTLPQPALWLPGNHDVGDLPDLRADQRLDDERLARYRDRAGDDRWMRDAGGWRLIGLDAMLCATGHPDEHRQYEWLEAALAVTGPVALFLHKPLFVDDPNEPARGYWTIPPAPRRRILDLLARADVRLIASGHLHVARHARFGETDHVWCPSAAFVCGPSQIGVPGERRIGYVVHELDPDRVESRFVFPAGAEPLPIEPRLDRIYPGPSAADDRSAVA